jgi:hypothetical protein
MGTCRPGRLHLYAFHGPGWTPQDTFESEVRRFSVRPCWVMKWQYSQVRTILAQRADLLIWLDLPRALVMWPNGSPDRAWTVGPTGA